MHRLLVIGVTVIAGLVASGTAGAWSWPADGAVLRPFALGPDAYAAGQHRGIDVAGVEGSAVRAPAAGTVTFAGSVPTNGRGVTILTADGYAVTLFHLGTIGVAKGDTVAEGAQVGSMGWSGEPEHGVPSVHLGVRVAAQAEGYLDPARFLPARPAPTASPPPAPPPAPAPAPAPTPAPSPPTGSPAPPPAPAPAASPGPSSQPATATPSTADATPGTAGGSPDPGATPASPPQAAGRIGAGVVGQSSGSGSAPGVGGGVVITAPPPRAGPIGRSGAAASAEQPVARRSGGVGAARVARVEAAGASLAPAARLAEAWASSAESGTARMPPTSLAATPGRPSAQSEPLRRSGGAGEAASAGRGVAAGNHAPGVRSRPGGGAERLPIAATALALATLFAGAATRRAARRVGGNGAVRPHDVGASSTADGWGRWSLRIPATSRPS